MDKTNKMAYFGFQWHITDCCDQRCKHCYYDWDSNPYVNQGLPYEMLSVILDNIIETCNKMKRKPHFAITGGDPLLYKDVWKLFTLFKEKGIEFVILGNPFHLNDDVAKKLKECGCVRYQMSLDGLKETHDSIRKPGSFDVTLSKIPVLKKAGITAAIMTTISKMNIKEIPNLVDIVVEHEADSFAFARYCPNPNDKENIVTAKEYRDFLETMWIKYTEYKDSKTWFIMKDHLWKLFLYEKGMIDIKDVDNPDNLILDGCHCGISHLTILADGTVYACRRCESPVGHVPEQSLYDIFFGKEMEPYRQYDKYAKCSKCELLNFCRGCPSVAKCLTGDFCAADPQCWKVINN